MKIAMIWLASMSLISFVLMGCDKLKAKQHKRRISEKCLFGFALLGGAVGGSVGMYLFRHKTKHWYFKLFFPLFALLQLGALWYFFM